MKKVINDVGKLISENIIDKSTAEEIKQVSGLFNFKVPKAYSDKIKVFDNSDPVYKTAIPSAEELIDDQDSLIDPIGDSKFSPTPGIVHRYPDRVLFMPTNICAVYCRYCFRKEVVGKSHLKLTADQLSVAISYIAEHQEIWEVIFTGGDPLIIPNQRLRSMLDMLVKIQHVKVIRFHTRIPAVEPARIDNELVELFQELNNKGKAVYVVTHINHSQEIDHNTERAIQKLVNVGVPVLNQSVLLKGINDTTEEMARLLKRLVEIRVKPYYLHHPDKVPGTTHFKTSVEVGQNILKELRGNISGLCLPTYILDIPGGFGKVPITYNYMNRLPEGYEIEDIHGNIHAYK